MKIDKKKDIISTIRLNPEKFSPKAIDYFTTIGLELFSIEFIKEAERILAIQKELDFGN